MRGVYGRPWLALDDLVPLEILDAEAINMELATAPRNNNVWGVEFPKDFIHFMRCPPDASPAVQEFYERNKNNRQAIANFAKLQYQAYSPTWTVRLVEMDKRLAGKVAKDFQLAVDDPTMWTPIPNIFPSVHRFIRESGVFQSTGRMNFFITDHNCNTPEHTDYQHDSNSLTKGYHAAAEKEFLWISLAQQKNFYVLDEATGTKHVVTSKCAWFNTLDRHGGDPVRPQTWSLRIDGVFTPEFRNKLSERFGNGLPLLHW